VTFCAAAFYLVVDAAPEAPFIVRVSGPGELRKVLQRKHNIRDPYIYYSRGTLTPVTFRMDGAAGGVAPCESRLEPKRAVFASTRMVVVLGVCQHQPHWPGQAQAEAQARQQRRGEGMCCCVKKLDANIVS